MMTTEPKPQPKPKPKPKNAVATAAQLAASAALARRVKQEQESERVMAHLAMNGIANVNVVDAYLPTLKTHSSLAAVAEAAREQVRTIASGDLTQLETMLLTQATALQAMFVDLAVRAKEQTHRDWQQLHTKLALKCAAQSRQAITALAELRMPRTVMFAKQANMTSGPQQINVHEVHSRASDFQTAPNKLMEDRHGQGVDSRAASQASGTDSKLETVGEIDRAEVASREKAVESKRRQRRPT